MHIYVYAHWAIAWETCWLTMSKKGFIPTVQQRYTCNKNTNNNYIANLAELKSTPHGNRYKDILPSPLWLTNNNSLNRPFILLNNQPRQNHISLLWLSRLSYLKQVNDYLTCISKTHQYKQDLKNPRHLSKKTTTNKRTKYSSA